MVHRDVTDIMSEQEKQNAELQRALEIANRASHARDEFLSSMSHDLRTPLNGIIGAAELAKLFGDEVPDMVQEYLDDIISSGHFMLNLVNDIWIPTGWHPVNWNCISRRSISSISYRICGRYLELHVPTKESILYLNRVKIFIPCMQIRCVYSEYLATCCQMRSSLHHPVVQYIFVQ